MSFVHSIRPAIPRGRDRAADIVVPAKQQGRGCDCAGVGINFMVTQHFDEIDVEFALTEGGGATLGSGDPACV
jgi:hypothetical protein